MPRKTWSEIKYHLFSFFISHYSFRYVSFYVIVVFSIYISIYLSSYIYILIDVHLNAFVSWRYSPLKWTQTILGHLSSFNSYRNSEAVLQTLERHTSCHFYIGKCISYHCLFTIPLSFCWALNLHVYSIFWVFTYIYVCKTMISYISVFN